MAEQRKNPARTFRLAESDIDLLDELGNHFGQKESCDPLDRTAVLRRAIRRLFAAEIGGKRNPKKSAIRS